MTSLLAIGRGFPPTIQLGLCSQSEQICTNPGSTKFDWANSHKLSSIDDLKKMKSEAGARYCPVGKLNTVSAAARCESHQPTLTAHLSHRSWKREKILRRRLAPREHKAR
jgi:hypothetical protein